MGDDANAEGHTLVARARAERKAGRRPEAVALYCEAAEIARRTGDALTLAHRLRHVGDIHLEDRRLDLAAPCYEEALALYRGRDDVGPLDLANLLRPLALLNEGEGRPDAARAFWAEARALYAKCGVEAGVEECARHLAAL